MDEHTSLGGFLWQAVLTLGGLVLGWLHMAHRSEVSDMKQTAANAQKRAEDTDKALAAHKLHAAETFARKDEVKSALDKIDARFDRVLDDLDEIKTRLPTKH